MQITVQFFAQLRDVTERAEETVELPDGATAADLLAQLYRQHPGLEKWDRSILLGVGVEFVERDYQLQPNDQLAIMPPVQGG